MVVFSPAWLLAYLVAKHAENIPIWDGWQRVDLLEKWHAGTLTFADLYAPHIDHRMVFPRLLMLFLNTVGDGDVRWEIGAIWAIGFAAGLGVWRLGIRTLGPGIWSSGVVFLCNLWIFSPIQYDNWLWPIQTSFMLPMTCLVWALVVTCGPARWWLRALSGIALATVGTLSFSHGLFIWPAVFGALLMMPREAPAGKGKWPFLACWTLAGAAVIGCYFLIDYSVATHYSYNRPIGAPTPLAGTWKESFRRFGDMAEFFLRILGGPAVRQFAIDPLPLSRLFGTMALAVYLGAALWIAFGVRNREWRARLLPWMALGGAVVAIALGVSVGRTTILASARATVPRFISVSLYLPIALLAFAMAATRGWERARVIFAPGGRKEMMVIGGLTMLAVLQVQPWIYGSGLMEIWNIARRQARAHVMFAEHWDPEPSRILAYLPGEIRDFAPRLDALGFLDPPLVRNLRLDQFSVSRKPMPSSSGQIRSAEKIKDGRIRLEGFSIFRGPDRPGDAVLLTARKAEGGARTIVGLADYAGRHLPTQHRIDLQFTVMEPIRDSDPESWMNWTETLEPGKLTDHLPGTIEVWALDVRKMRVYPLPNRLELDADGRLELTQP